MRDDDKAKLSYSMAEAQVDVGNGGKIEQISTKIARPLGEKGKVLDSMKFTARGIVNVERIAVCYT